MRAFVATGMTMLIVAAPAAQAPPPASDQPRFDVASIKVNVTNDGIVFNQSQKGRYTLVGYTLAAMIRSAYRVQEFQIIGGPDWMNIERFNLEATYSEAALGELVADGPQDRMIFAPAVTGMWMTDGRRAAWRALGQPELALQADHVLGRECDGVHRVAP